MKAPVYRTLQLKLIQRKKKKNLIKYGPMCSPKSFQISQGYQRFLDQQSFMLLLLNVNSQLYSGHYEMHPAIFNPLVPEGKTNVKD